MGTKAVGKVVFTVALAFAGVHACGTTVPEFSRGGDSESHFLSMCTGRCSGGLTCVCGVCTRGCDGATDCTNVSRRAECARDTSTCKERICDVTCSSDDTCQSLGSTYACIQGRCRETSAPREAGADVDVAPGNVGGSAGSQGATTGSGGQGQSAPRDASTCTHATVPPAPMATNSGGNVEIVVAQSNVDFGDSEPASGVAPTRFRNIGFDLDGRCDTMVPYTSLCELPTNSDGVIDGPGGIDNSFGLFVQIMRNLLTTFSSDIYSSQLKKGAANSILHVTGYNGKPDDDQVVVEALVSARFNAFDPKATPKWDGNDVWPVAEDSVIDRNLKKPRNVDPHAYVSGGKLVATLGDTGLRLLIGFTDAYQVNLTLFLHAAYTVCDIEPIDAGPWGFTLKNCTLAGRWTADDLIKQLWHFPDPLDLKNPKPLCTNSTSYAGFKDTICRLRDIASSGTAGPTAPCDALSMGVNFQTYPARMGDVFANDLFSPRCPADTDPSNDSCDAVGRDH